MAVRTSIQAQIATRGAPAHHRNWLPYLLVLPILIYEGIFIILPILNQFVSSFTTDVIGAGPVKWVGLANYDRLWNDSEFWMALRVTLMYVVLVVLASVGIGLISATLLNLTFRGRSIARAIVTLPWAFPDVPAILVFVWILNPNFGVMNVLARLLLPGLDQNPKWLVDAGLAMPAVIGVTAWKHFPFFSLVLLSAMQSIPHELYEAALVDGAGHVRAFRHVILPGILPTLILLTVLAAIYAFKHFVLIWLTTGGGPGGLTETLVIKMYNTAFRFFDFSYGATIGMVGLLLSGMVAVFYTWLQRRRELEAGS